MWAFPKIRGTCKEDDRGLGLKALPKLAVPL